jgi:transposase
MNKKELDIAQIRKDCLIMTKKEVAKKHKCSTATIYRYTGLPRKAIADSVPRPRKDRTYKALTRKEISEFLKTREGK